ncbi:MAG: sulfotransferase [Rhodothalassiaceae bacterium]
MSRQSDRSHPLWGADLATLLRIAAECGPLQHGARGRFYGAFAAALGRLPFSLAEAAYTAMRRTAVESRAEAPVFILGHWRSGTTHLYNVLSKSPHFAYVSPFATALPHDFLLLGRMLAPMLKKKLPAHRYIDNIPVEPDSPQEDEIALANMTPLSFYHALYFPGRFEHFFARGLFFDGVDAAGIMAWQRMLKRYYAKLMIAQPGRRLLIKNPVYTARPEMLRAMWPDAKFIHIHRNPARVFLSMRNFWQALFRQFALADWSKVDIDAVILATYERMMAAYVRETEGWPEDRLIELSFEEFQRDPMACVERIHERLDIAGYAESEPCYRRYLESVSGYRKNSYERADEAGAIIGERWRPFIERWGYDRAA